LKPRELTFIKLGGSLLTDKRQAGSFHAEVVGRLAGELEETARSSPGGLLVGHGSGSFGHATADEHRIHPGEIRSEQLPGVVATQQRRPPSTAWWWGLCGNRGPCHSRYHRRAFW